MTRLNHITFAVLIMFRFLFIDAVPHALSHVFPKEHNNHRMSKIQITESKFASLVYEKHDFPTTNILLNSAT